MPQNKGDTMVDSGYIMYWTFQVPDIDLSIFCKIQESDKTMNKRKKWYGKDREGEKYNETEAV